MFSKNQMYYSNANISNLPRNHSCYTFNNESNSGTKFGVNRYQSMNCIGAHQSKIENQTDDLFREMNGSYSVDNIEITRKRDDEKLFTNSGLDPKLFQRQNSYYSIQNYWSEDLVQSEKADAEMYNILENIQKEKQMFKKETEKMSNRLKYTEAAFFELRNQHLKCLHSMELKDQEIAHLKSIISYKEVMHLVNQTETRKPLLISSRLSLNQDELNAIKSIDNSDETNFQVSKIGKTKPNSYSTPNNNNNNDNQVSKSYKKILNESLGSSQLTSNTKRLNEVDNEVLTNSKTDFKRELKYNLAPNDLDLDLLCHNKGLIDVNTSPTKNRTTNKIKKVLCKFVKSNFKSSKRNERKSSGPKRLQNQPFKLERAKTIEI